MIEFRAAGNRPSANAMLKLAAGEMAGFYVSGSAKSLSNIIRWIEKPDCQSMDTRWMPNVGGTHQDAIDIAGYLYTLQQERI